MAIVLAVLEIVTPVFILAAIGAAWVRLGFDYDIEFVTRLTMTVSIPCLVFMALVKTRIAPADLSAVLGASVAAYGVLSLAMAALLLLLRLPLRTWLAPLIFGNTGNLGLPLALFAFGQAGLGYAVVIFAFMIVYNFTFGIWLVAGGGSITKVLKEPLLWGTLLGILFMFQGWSVPRWAANTLDLPGQMAIPLMLTALGVAMARLRPVGVARALGLAAVKLAASVGAAWLAGRWFQLPPVAFAVLVLQLSTPVAVSSYLLAEKYKADSQSVAGLVVVSTLLAVVSLPVLLAVLL